MIRMGKVFSFSAAHHLPHHEGQCKAHHGHNYKLEVVVACEEFAGPFQTKGAESGMVMDFGRLTTIVKETVLDLHDHKDLNQLYTNPTAEHMVAACRKDIRNELPMGIRLIKLKLWETEKCYAEWTAD